MGAAQWNAGLTTPTSPSPPPSMHYTPDYSFEHFNKVNLKTEIRCHAAIVKKNLVEANTNHNNGMWNSNHNSSGHYMITKSDTIGSMKPLKCFVLLEASQMALAKNWICLFLKKKVYVAKKVY